MALVAGSRAEVRVEVNGTTEARREIESVGDVMGGLGGKISAMAGTLGAVVGALAGVAAFGSWIKGAIDATDAASDLSQKTGIAIKDLAGLELAYQMGGMEAEALAGSQAKLSKAMVDGNATLEKLGISSKNLDGSLKSNKEVMYAVADSFAGMEDGAKKTALAMDLFGKSGADMIPMLNGGSEGMRELDEMAAKLGLTLSDEAVEQAGQFNDTLDLLMLGGQGVARGIAAELLPTLSSLAGSFLTAMTEGDRLKTVGQLIAGVFKLLYTVAVPAVEMFSTVGKVIGGFATMIKTNLTGAIDVLSKVAGGDFTGAWDAVKRTATAASGVAVDVATDVSKGWIGAWNNVVNVWTNGGNEMVDTMATIKRASTTVGLSAAEVAKQTAAANKEHAAEAKLMAELSGLSGTFAQEWDALSGAYAKGALNLEQLTAAQADLLAKQPRMKAALEIEIKARKELADFEDRYRKAQAFTSDLMGEMTRAAEAEAAQQEELARTFGLSALELERLHLARLEDQLAQRSSLGLTLDEIETLEKLISAKKRTVEAMSNMEELGAHKRMWDSIESTAHDTFISIFDSGKSAFDRLTDTLKNGLYELLYQMTVKQWIINIGASVGYGGGSTAMQTVGALAGNGGGGGASPIALAQSAANLYKMASGGFAAVGAGIGQGLSYAGNAIGSNSIYSFGQGMQGFSAGGVGSGISPTAAGYGQMAGTAVGYLAGAAAGVYGGRAISNGYAISGSGNGAVNAGTIVGAIVAGPIGAAIGGIIAGTANRLFGHRPKEYVGENTLVGTLGENFNGQLNALWKKKGGTFRSDKWGTDVLPVDQEMSKDLVAAYASVKAASADYAKALGLDATSIMSRTDAINIKFGNDSAANEKAIAEFFEGVADSIAVQTLPQLVNFKKAGESASATFQRLAVDFQATDALAQMLGKSAAAVFGSAGLSSLAARERLIELAGGIDVLTQQASAYSQNFLTEAERLKPVSEALSTAMAGLGLSAVTTRAQFKQVIDGLDLTTDAGAKQYVAMMNLAEIFALVHPATIDLSTQRAALTEAYNTETEALASTITRMGSFATSLRNLKNSALLGNLSPLSPSEKYAEARSQYEAVLAAARAGDENAQGRYQEVYTAFLEASRAVNASSIGYTRDFEYAQAATEEAAKWAERQIDVNKAQLDVLKLQVSGIIEVNKSVLSVREALLQYNAAAGKNTAPLTGYVPVNPPPIVAGRTGQAGMDAVVTATKMLGSEVAKLRSEQAQHTAALIATQTRTSSESAAAITGAVKSTASTEYRVLPS